MRRLQRREDGAARAGVHQGGAHLLQLCAEQSGLGGTLPIALDLGLITVTEDGCFQFSISTQSRSQRGTVHYASVGLGCLVSYQLDKLSCKYYVPTLRVI